MLLQNPETYFLLIYKYVTEMAPPLKKTTRNASKQYLAEHMDISLGDSLYLRDYIL